jgi:dienelactone hydrolase
MMDADTLVIEDGDLDVARRLADTVDGVQLYLYPGDRHLFIDSSLPDYDQTATELVTDRITALVDSAP